MYDREVTWRFHIETDREYQRAGSEENALSKSGLTAEEDRMKWRLKGREITRQREWQIGSKQGVKMVAQREEQGVGSIRKERGKLG